MHKISFLAPLAAIATLAAAMSADASEARTAAAGGCGEYMYWHDGKCADARARPPLSWSETMAKKSNW